MTTSIESLDLRSQELLDLESKESQYHLRMELVDLIAAWIKSSRLAAGLTQPELGELIGVTKQNVSHWENKRHEPRQTTCRPIGNTMSCNTY